MKTKKYHVPYQQLMGYMPVNHSRRKKDDVNSAEHHFGTRSTLGEDQSGGVMPNVVDNHADVIFFEIPYNSELMRQFETNHPRIAKFERKYQGVDWRSKLMGVEE